MDDVEGIIGGKSFEDVSDTYIVILDEPYNGRLAVAITEACLEPIDENIKNEFFIEAIDYWEKAATLFCNKTKFYFQWNTTNSPTLFDCLAFLRDDKHKND